MIFWNKKEQNSYFKKNPSLAEFIRFCIVGVTGTIVDFGIYTILKNVAGMYYIWATCISVFLAIINNFLLNKYWTFKKGSSGKFRKEYAKFFTVSIINYFLNIGITYSIVEFTQSEVLFGHFEDYFAKAVAIGVVLFSNYFGNKYWTFRS